MFNKIIDIVEDNVTANSKELYYTLKSKLGYTNRQLSEAFSLITGLSINKYHIIRKLEYAAKKIINNDYDSLADLAQEISYNDQAAFSKAFKKQFGVSPVEANDSNIVTHGKMVINITVDWGDKSKMKTEKGNAGMMINIPDVVLEEYQEVLEFAAFYGTDSDQTFVVYKLAIKYGIDLQTCFEFFVDYLELCSWDSAQCGISITKYLEYDSNGYYHTTPTTIDEVSPDYVFMFQKFKMFPTESFDFIESYYKFYKGIDINNITDIHIQLFKLDNYNKYTAKDIEQIMKGLSENPRIDFDDFIDWLQRTHYDSYWGCEDAVNEYLDYLEMLGGYLGDDSDEDDYFPSNPELTAEDYYDIYVDYSSEKEDYPKY